MCLLCSALQEGIGASLGRRTAGGRSPPSSLCAPSCGTRCGCCWRSHRRYIIRRTRPDWLTDSMPQPVQHTQNTEQFVSWCLLRNVVDTERYFPPHSILPFSFVAIPSQDSVALVHRVAASARCWLVWPIILLCCAFDLPLLFF